MTFQYLTCGTLHDDDDDDDNNDMIGRWVGLVWGQADTIIVKQMKGFRRIMRPLKARGREWVHGLTSGGGGDVDGGSSKVPRLGRPSGNHGIRSGGGQEGQSRKKEKDEDEDSDGSDLVRKVKSGD